MKLKKGILSVLIITLGILLLTVNTNVNAAAANTLYLGLEQYRSSGYSYRAIEKVMWKIASYDSEEGPTAENPKIDLSKTIYCIKAGAGFGSRDMGGSYVGAVTVRPYTQSFDLKDINSIKGNYLAALPSGSNYNSLIWVLEHCYVPENDPEGEYRAQLLEAAGIANSDISDDEIDVAQQLAIWYFTNNDENDDYHITDRTFYLEVKEKEDPNYIAIGDKFRDNGDERNDDAQALFNYLVSGGIENDDYEPTPNNTKAPVSINTANSEIKLEGENYILGPYTLNDEGVNLESILTASLKKGEEDVPFTILDDAKNSSDIKNMVGKQFYISVAKELYDSGLKFQISAKTYETAITYWSVVNAPETDQPVVEIGKKETTYEIPLITPNKPGEKAFDLSLRKFITGVNNTKLVDSNGKYIKEPIPDVTPLKNGTATTAIYKHQKAPVGVTVGDEVIYTIRVYNEGEIDGYVTEITDHLPPQLEFVNDSFNAKYGWSVSANGRTVKTTITSPDTALSANRDDIYSQRTDTEDKVLLKAFEGEELDYIDVQIKCKVKEVEDLDTIITNIAEITGFTDSNGDIVVDRDSTADSLTNNNSKPADDIQNDNLPTDEEFPEYKGRDTNKSVLTDKEYHYKGQQDDDDFDKLILQEFDLALRKFITGVNEEKVTNRYPTFTTDKDENGNYIYTHTKEPVEVETTDQVEYTIRIYNEGNIAGYAKQIKDNIPNGLEFLPENETNKEYRWIMLDEEGKETEDVAKAKYITTDYLSKEQEKTAGENLIKGFDKETMSTPNYKDVKVVFKVIAPNSYEGIITNIAEISDDSDENGNPVIDRDSTPNNDNEKEDDIDVEHIKLTYFDLALRKFITAVDKQEVTNRYPVFSIDENGNYIYTHTKEPVEVENGNIVTYTLRIYNEGTKAGYAKQVKDDLPEGLEFLPENETNKEYRWIMLDEEQNETEDITKAVSISTDYLSKAQENETGRNNLLKPFDKNTMEEPDYRDIKIAFKVTEPNTSDRILINKAQIADDEDKNGKPVIDKDSTPDKWIEGEDDQDIEKVKVKYFDLALRKWVTQAIVIEDGKEKVIETGHKAEDDPEEVVKVEIAKSKLNKVVVKFRYKIRVTNEGEIAGYATEISDYIPEGLKFVAADNPTWKQVDGKIVTNALENTLLQPGEKAEVEVLLTWINGSDNMGLKVNVAEISKDKNDSDTPDIDSTPNNKKPGEDDIDDAPVILSTKTGELLNTSYIILAAGALAILSTGVILIKKYVL